MFKIVILLIIIFVFSALALTSQTLRRLPLPDDLTQPVLSPKTEVTPPTRAETPATTTIPLPPPPARPTVTSIPVVPGTTPQPVTEEIVSHQRRTTTPPPADRPLNPNFIDENMQNFNNLTNTIFESLRLQYNYILKLESEINNMRDEWQAERQKFAEEHRLLSFNIGKLEEQNDSYLGIFEKLRDDNEALENHINQLEQTISSKSNRIDQLENAINTMQQRLMQIRDLTNF